jgi:hypothetical protein
MDAVALAATIGGSVVALAGVGVTAWSVLQQRQSAKELASMLHAHERDLARSARLFERRSEAYHALLGLLQVYWERILDTEPMIRVAGAPDPPEAPGSDDWRPMYVRLRTFGSPEVTALYEEFAARVQAFFLQAGLLRSVMDRRGRTEEREPWQETQEAREAVKDTFDRLQRVVSEELASL